jgi:hypothetical protein
MNGIPAFPEDQSLILIGIHYDHVPINKAESERTVNPLQTTAFFGVKKGVRRDAVDGGNPLQDDV